MKWKKSKQDSAVRIWFERIRWTVWELRLERRDGVVWRDLAPELTRVLEIFPAISWFNFKLGFEEKAFFRLLHIFGVDIGNQRRRYCRRHRVGFRKQLISGHPPKKENTFAGASVVKYQILAHSVMNHDDSLDRHDFEKTTVTLKNIF